MSNQFICHTCDFSAKFDYFGCKPPFVKAITLMEEAYVIKDPFSSQHGYIILGSHCALCQKSVCMAQNCSLFYTKRFCYPCIIENIEEFPEEIQMESYVPVEQVKLSATLINS